MALSGTCGDSWGCPVKGQELHFDYPSGALPTQDILCFYASVFLYLQGAFTEEIGCETPESFMLFFFQLGHPFF